MNERHVNVMHSHLDLNKGFSTGNRYGKSCYFKPTLLTLMQFPILNMSTAMHFYSRDPVYTGPDKFVNGKVCKFL